ncbi:MAG TPA: AAA family ATPase, partial [Candidatus Glassbacteria bacterium]|nr:AAA family ATPase [Candidatus Glassbacteria bacterium]
MKLKAIEISGFKSFVNKVRLEFPEGLTAIVGPNGCGKTNVIEAVRWVLGEQNIRTLRGERMEEVIFNGTTQRKPLGMAEVRLFFLDPGHRMGLDSDEFVIGRQIFRSGESNYYINNRLCRLKDVQDLFMDTGMGSNAYSMIEQRMVEAVLSDRAEERRFLFEEAAGIQKYKLRRRFAARKLEATDGDLLRINDIVGEVERTVNSLGRQVSKARRYQKLSQLLRRVAVTLARSELAGLSAERKPLAERLQGLKERLAELSAAESTRAARSEELHTEVNQRQSLAEELFAELDGLSCSIREAEDELTANREKRAAAADWIAEAGRRLEGLAANIETRQSELEEFVSQVDTLSAEVKYSEEEYSVARREVDEKVRQEQQARAELAEVQRRREELVSRVASCTSRAEAIEDAASYERKRVAELQERIGALAVKFNETAGRLNELDRKISSAEEEKKVRRRELEDCAEKLSQAAERAEEIEKEAGAVALKRDRLEAEKELLERLQREMEGYGEGVKALFSGELAAEGVEAVAAEIFKTEERFERAVEAALGLRV